MNCSSKLSFRKSILFSALGLALTYSQYSQAVDIQLSQEREEGVVTYSETLLDSARVGGNNSTALLADVYNSELVSTSKLLSKVTSVNPEILVEVVNSQVCDLETAGACVLLNKDMAVALGTQKNSDGSISVMQGYFDMANNKDKNLSKVTQQLSARAGGKAVIYTRLTELPKRLENVQTVVIARPEDGAVVAKTSGQCKLEASLTGTSHRRAKGRGLVTCKYFSGETVSMKVKVASKGLDLGSGMSASKLEFEAEGVGITNRGPTDLVGDYVMSNSDSGLVAKKGEMTMSIGTRYKKVRGSDEVHLNIEAAGEEKIVQSKN